MTILTPNMTDAEKIDVLIGYIMNGDEGGWLPIETAPKDGTIVDVWAQSRYTDVWWDEKAKFINGEWNPGWVIATQDESAYPDYIYEMVTHWRPLPKSPNVQI